MGDLVNLKRARKARERQKSADVAAANRLRFGLTKAERKRIDSERQREETRLDGARLDEE